MKARLIIVAFIFLLFAVSAEAANRYWRGGSGNWSDTDHWSRWSNPTRPTGASVPGDKDEAIFDGDSGGGTCTIDQNVDVRGIELQSGNTTAISQGAYTITIGSQNATFTAGTFTGGTANIDINGSFTLQGASFTSTSETLYCGDTFTISSGTFTHNSGTVEFDTARFTITPGAATFNNVIFNAAKTFTVASGTTLTVAGTLNLTDGTVNTGTIAAQGNIINLASTFDGGTASLNITGTATQTLTGGGSATAGDCLAVNINKTGGSLTLASTIRTGNNWTYTAGTMNSGSSTVVFVDDVTISGAMSFDSTTFNGNNKTFSIGASSAVTVEDNLTLTDGTISIPSTSSVTVQGTTTLTDGQVNTGSLNAQGNVTVASTFDGGTGTLSLTGTSDQTLTGNSGGDFTDTLDINKSSGTATITGTCSGIQSITVSAGTLDFDGGYTYTIDDADSITVSSDATLNLTGTAGSLVTLRSDRWNRQWDLDVDTQADYSADYVDVQNSNATGRRIFATNSTDSDRNTHWYFVPGSLTSTDVQPGFLQVGVTSLVTASFTTTNPLPADGVIEIDFPSGFDGTGCDTVSDASGIDGSFSVSTSNGDGTNDIITITRSGGTEVAASTAASFKINSITNPSVIGSAGTYSIKTQDKGAVPTIDQDTAITADTIITATSKIAFTTSSQTLIQNQTSILMTIETQDSAGDTRVVVSDTQINLSSSSLGGRFAPVDSPGDWSIDNTLSITIPSGSSSASFYYKDSVVGSPTLTASESPSSGWTDATQQQTINFAVNTFTVTASTPQVAGSEFTLIITAIAASGEVATTYSDTVNLTVNYISPASGSGTLSVTSTSTFINGIATITNQTFSDCGTITITATEADDSTKMGMSSNILFIPYDFTISADVTLQTVNNEFTLTVTARNAQGVTCPNYQGSANLSIGYVSPSTDQSGTITPSSLDSDDFTSGVASVTTTKYDKWGTITIRASDSTDSSHYGDSDEITFIPKDFIVMLSDPPASRNFYYAGEEFTTTVTCRDQDNNTITNYQGTMTLSSSDGTISNTYIFLTGDLGIHEFSISITSAGDVTLTAQDTTYTSVSGSSSTFEIKEAKIKVVSTSGPVGNIAVSVQVLDSEDNIITEDDSTTFTVSLQEGTDNDSATCEATTIAVTIRSGLATIYVNDVEAESVTITPVSNPVLTPIAGIVNFGSFQERGFGIDIWREIR